jgi:predicted membrane channel-forming protein YqfA (hemolysin III family)
MKQNETIRWVLLVVIWGLACIPFIQLFQKKHFAFLIVGLFLFVCASIVLFWFTCKGKQGAENLPPEEQDSRS